jgi:UDP-N-acetylmuramyl tripeptide synthase
MRLLALWIGKTTFVILRLLKRRGAALPGLVVERLFPGFLKKSLQQLPEGVIIITGTNGKTTSTKMLTHVLRAQYRVLTNPTGSNFVRGIVASIVQHSRWSGELPYDIGVFELDEAYAAQFVKLYKPRAVVVLNVMRDQMDRFGEIDHTARLLNTVVKNATGFVVLNADDTRVASMAEHVKVPTYFFAVDASLRDVFRNDDELHEDTISERKQSNISAKLKKFDTNNMATIELDGEIIKTTLLAQGTYNAQNATAVCLAASALKISVEQITTRISEVSPAFGRGEYIKVGQIKVVLQLVKNPGGFRHALLSGSRIDQQATMIAINDDYPDGRDVSWLWDVSFINAGVKGKIITSGVRAADMALRLKYDDIATELVEPNLSDALDSLLGKSTNTGTVLIYTTYTAMLELRRLLSKKTEVEKV